MSASTLPSDLYDRVIAQFDELQKQGVLLYQDTIPEYVTHHGFRFQFRNSPALLKKPILSSDDPRRKTDKGGPFSDPEPEFVVTALALRSSNGKDDVKGFLVQMNKYCMLRPHLLLHPKDFEKQTEDLSQCDVEAAWMVMESLRRSDDKKQREWMVFYNCGVEAGASQGHKHMQIVERPAKDEFMLFPDDLDLKSGEPTSDEKVPFINHIIGISANSSPTEIYSRYQKVLAQTKESLKRHERDMAYNFIMTRDWIVLVPRTSKGNHNTPTNAAGMLGMVWVRSDEERERWSELGMNGYLASLGIPRDTK